MQHRPRKRFGQHFLHDPVVIQRIVDAIRPQAGQRIIEIGPGQGVLSAPLLALAGELHVIEIDRDLIAALARRFAQGLHIHNGDVLAFNFDTLLTPPQQVRIVGNLPYNISTPLLFHVLRWAAHIQDMVFMLQKEVVERLAARPGSEAYGRLSVMMQYHCAIDPLFEVGPGAFTPPPQVDSAVVALYPHPQPPVDVSDFAVFAQVVQQAFAMRRKTLRNNLKGLLSSAEIGALGISPNQRAETLGLPEFAALARVLEAKNKR
jgi:16S rRNA (adenine1518-N6/adenine1519-N6)-dimethyltransferase